MSAKMVSGAGTYWRARYASSALGSTSRPTRSSASNAAISDANRKVSPLRA